MFSGSTHSGRGQHKLIHRGSDETFWSLRLRGEDSTNSLMKEEAGLRDGRFWGVRLRGENDTNWLIEERRVRGRDEGSWSLRLRLRHTGSDVASSVPYGEFM